MYTDGVTETLNMQNQEFGRERLINLCRQADHKPVKEMVQEIKQRLDEFGAGKPLADDTTIVICKIS
jgi:sigma-B regulation protein RsbU (phosphoserine phosphatase)